MKKVFISYNPYKLVTNITVDGEKLKDNSEIRKLTTDDKRLQEWVDELPALLCAECSNADFEIDFHGTLFDYEDLVSVLTDSQNRGEITVKCELKREIKPSNKEKLIDKVFKEIQEGPFDELRDPKIIKAFELAKSDEFEICVIATMSAGKSTLINAMLGQKLMPSKQEACTAMITRIKDIPTDDSEFKLEVEDIDGKKLESPDIATLDTLNMLNACPIKYRCTHRMPDCPKAPMKSDECPHIDKGISCVGTVNLRGNIPFIESDDVSLVLIDTPGPNNSRNKSHLKVQNSLLDKSSKALILYIMPPEIGTDDDNYLLGTSKNP